MTELKYVHIIVAGREGTRVHLAGLSRYKAHEVLVVNPTKPRMSDDLVHKIRELGLLPRAIQVENNYPDSFKKISKEIAGYMTDDTCIAINLSTGSRIVVSAIEDVIRTLLAEYHAESSYRRGPYCSAFRYSVRGQARKPSSIQVAPIWNTSNSFQNAIINTLIDEKRSWSIRELHGTLHNLEAYPSAYDSFRTLFRGMLNWTTGLPCFKEKYDRGQRFSLEF